jgi:hypothetical protein
MREHGVPYGSATHTTRLLWDLPGVYEVEVVAPGDLRVPVLPARYQRGVTKGVRWPGGCFKTVVTNRELSFALSKGYCIKTVHRGLVWEKTIYPFKIFVDLAEKIRKGNRKTAFEEIAKLMQNSLYGKFGSRRERKRIVTNVDESVGCVPLEYCPDFWVKTEYAADMMVLPQWAVFITANARLHLLKAVYDEVGVDNVLYGDTDSITVKHPGVLKNVGENYGQWKVDKEWSSFRAIAPKVYAGKRVNVEAGKSAFVGACKGIPSRQQGTRIFAELFSEGRTSIDIEYLPSFMVMMKSGERELKKVVRSSTDIANSLNWRVEGNDVFPRELS